MSQGRTAVLDRALRYLKTFLTLAVLLSTQAFAATDGIKIAITFESPGDPKWEDRILKNAKIAENILNSEAFKKEITARRSFWTTSDTGLDVWNKIRSAGAVTVSVAFYAKEDTKAIATSNHQGKVSFNTEKPEAGNPGNIAHEVMHLLGYRHRTNFAIFGSGSVPYVVGDYVERLSQ